MKKLFDKLFTYSSLTKIARTCIIVAPIFLLGYVVMLVLHHYCPFFHLWSITNFGVMGDFVGGVISTLFAIAAAMYVIKTYKKQLHDRKLHRFEATFMRMLELHKQNVSEINIKSSIEVPAGQNYNGRYAFPIMYKELALIYDETGKAIVSFLQNNPHIRYNPWRNPELMIDLAHKLSFGFFFYDVNGYQLTRDKNEALYDLTDGVVQILKQSPQMKNYLNLSRNIVLGHYFRHLYNMVKFVDDSRSLHDFKEREDYCKLIRSQMSDYEQIVLYYDTLSPLGAAWIQPLGVSDVENMSLLCKYRFVKNCPCFLSYFGKDLGSVFAVEDKAWRARGERFFETDLRIGI